MISFSIFFGSRLNEFGSISANIGKILFVTSELVVATKEKGVVIAKPFISSVR